MLPPVSRRPLGEKLAPAQKCLPAAHSTTARHSGAPPSSSGRWASAPSSGSSKWLFGGRFSSAVTTCPDRLTTMSMSFPSARCPAHKFAGGDHRIQRVGPAPEHLGPERGGIVAGGKMLGPPPPQAPGETTHC